MSHYKHFASVLIILLCLVASVRAEWSEPVFLGELNDHSYIAAGATVSADGLCIIFTRQVGPSHYQLFEARRESPDGPFTSELSLSHLNPGRHWVSTPWLSRDGLRLYYTQAIPENGQWNNYNIIRMATRNHPLGVWQTPVDLAELHVPRTTDFNAVLTEDELTVIWFACRPYPLPISDARAFTASRSSIHEPFSNERELPELTDMGAYHLYLSGDGLRVYFTAISPETGRRKIYKASRSSFNDPFENPEDMGFDGPDYGAGQAWLSPDEKTIYFSSNPPGQRGIWVSHWIDDQIDDPYEIALQRIVTAIEGKREILASLKAALDDDRLALEALEELRLLAVIDPVHILHAKTDIFRSIQRQIMAIREVERSIAELEQALFRLQSAPRQNLQRDPGKIKEQPVGPKIKTKN